jgi:heme/copper-type cytochrome/quinol oxidase subunit 4
MSGDIGRRSGPSWSRTRRLILSFLIGTVITLLAFWVMMANKAPWQFNYVLAPGAIVGAILGFITHYGDFWYELTVLGVNSAFYGALVYVIVSTAWPRLRRP